VEKLHVMRLRFRGQGPTPIGTRGPDTEIVSPHWPWLISHLLMLHPGFVVQTELHGGE